MLSKPSGNSVGTTMRRMVVDASVALKWFLKDELEDDVDLANEVLFDALSGNLQLHGPDIFFHEVDGGLTRACLTRTHRGSPPRMNIQSALDALETLAAYPIQIHTSTLAHRQEVLNMAVHYAKGNYDMIYLHLAEQLNCQWCMADERFLLSVRPGFPRHHVLLLSSLRVEAT